MASTVTTVSAKVSDEEKEILRQYCEENDETISRIVRKAIKEFIAKYCQPKN